MQDQDEQARLRDHFKDNAGLGHLAEQAMSERENALAYGDDGTVLRTEALLAQLGYATPEQRASAAKARKESAERAEREQERLVAAKGEAVAHDDHAGGPEDQHAGVVGKDGLPPEPAKSSARKQPPAGRKPPGTDKT